MKFSENWLRTWVNPPLDAQTLADTLTMAGLEVEALEAVAPPFTGVVVGEILSVVPHPQADRLNCLKVNVGHGEVLDIVCGAPNVKAGMKAPCARVGARLPGGLDIRLAKVRGVESSGMMCSEKELGLAETRSGLLVLADDAPPGLDLRKWLDLDDRLFTLKLTPNRADCLSLRGVAREVAALAGMPFSPPTVQPVACSPLPGPRVSVLEVEACPLYLGRALMLEHPDRPTPDWMVRRLERSGLRSRSLVVDVTNYALLELGQPMHVFDSQALKGGLQVRWAREGEVIRLLNEQDVSLQPDMLVIADESGPVALAGIMGGLSTAVTEGTRAVFLECAFFAPGAVAGRSRRLGVTSDSAYRFERGVDFGNARQAMERATALLLDLCGGQAGEVIEVRHSMPGRHPVQVRSERVNRVLGLSLDADRMIDLLSRLGCKVDGKPQGVFEVTPPEYRFDLAIEEDFIEEVARLEGYDRIPAKAPSGPQVMRPAPEREVGEEEVARWWAQRDYQEVVTYSFVDPEDEQRLSDTPSRLKLMNPIAATVSHMRSTLAVGLMNALCFNVSRKQERVRLFEVGRCFHDDGQDGFIQEKRLGGLVYGLAEPEQWSGPKAPVDFYDLKGDLEAALAGRSVSFRRGEHPALHPGRSAQMLMGDLVVGWLGELHPALLAHYDLPRAPLLFELALEPLLHRSKPVFQEVSRFQPVRRDMAVVVDEKMAAEEMLMALRSARLPGVQEVILFDVYQGEGLEQGKKSIAFRIVMQDTERTMTESELEAGVKSLLGVLQQRFDARLR